MTVEELETFEDLLVLLGYTAGGLPVYQLHGAAEDDEGDGDEEDDDEEDDEEDEDEDGEEDDDGEDGDAEPAGGRAPSAQEFQELQAAKRRSDHESAARRRLLTQMGVKFNSRTGEPSDPDYLERLMDAAATLGAGPPAGDRRGGDNGGTDERNDRQGGSPGYSQADVERAVAREVTRAEARAEARYKPALATMALEAALRAAGWSGESTDVAMRMLDLDEVDVEGDRVVGVQEQVDDLKAEFPMLFRGGSRRNGTRRGAEDVDGGDKRRRTPPPRKQSWEERISAQLDGRSS